jgi:type III secretion system FlhB-like substrate exporter
MGKRKVATAIGYSPEDPAPALFATGRDRQAERIIAVAEQAGVAVVEDEALAVLLDSWAFAPGAIRVKPGDFIPLWCWEAAAKILAFVTKEDYKE